MSRILLSGHSLCHLRQLYLAETLSKHHEVKVIAPLKWGVNTLDTERWDFELVGLPPNVEDMNYFTLNGFEEEFKQFNPSLYYIMEEPWTEFAFRTAQFAVKECPYVVHTYENRQGNILSPNFGVQEKFVVENSSAVVCGNRGAFSRMLRYSNPPYLARLPLTGVNTELFRKMDVEKWVDVVYAGRFVDEKGWRILQEVILELDIQPLWIGCHQNLMVINGRAYGWIPYDNMPEFLNRAKIAVQFPFATAGWIEQFNMSVVEALACEIPVVCSNSGALKEYYSNRWEDLTVGVGDKRVPFYHNNISSHPPFMVEENNKEELKGALEQLLGYSDLSDMGRDGRRFVEQNFSNEVVAKKLCEVFEEVME